MKLTKKQEDEIRSKTKEFFDIYDEDLEGFIEFLKDGR